MDLLQVFTHNFLSFIAIISIIVFIHEYGHFWVARRCGVKIESFSLGFGPEVCGWHDKKGTRWKLSLIPLGGYVKMFGDTDAASTPDHDALKKMTSTEKRTAFYAQPLLNRFLIVAAGPAANFILAILILTFFFGYYGRPETTSVIGQVTEESAAAELGLRAGDKITELNGKNVDSFREIQQIVSMHPSITISISYERDGNVTSAEITPRLHETTDLFGNQVKVGLLGVMAGDVIHKTMGVGQASLAAVQETWSLTARTLEALGQMITGQRSSKELSGILRIAEYSGQSVERGLETVFWFMAILSINLGLINLFPIPMLDGGHLFFYIIEGLRGKPLPEKMQEYFFRVGFALLILLMLYATFNDFRHFGIL